MPRTKKKNIEELESKTKHVNACEFSEREKKGNTREEEKSKEGSKENISPPYFNVRSTQISTRTLWRLAFINFSSVM